MLPLARNKVTTFLSLLATSALAIALVLGCTKTNKIDAGPGAGPGACNGDACDGACVEGICRAYCDQNYQCAGDDTCADVDNVAVCIPPGARVYEPYQPFRMLDECAASGCEIPLDAPVFEGVLRTCNGSYTAADVASPDFDYESACATLDDYSYQLVQGRRIYDLWGEGTEKSCQWSHLGAGAADSLIRYSCAYDYTDTLITMAEFARVIERGGVTYVWTNGPTASASADDVHPQLSVLSDGEQLELPSSCGFGQYAGDLQSSALPKDCELPTYPALGRAVGPEFEGLWVSCDTPNADAPEQCDLDFDGPNPEGHPRTAYYIDARGYGQAFGFEGGVAEARASKCSAAFRLRVEDVDDPDFGSYERTIGYIVGSEIPFGMVGVEATLLDEVVEVTDGPGTAAGTYIVGNHRSNYWYKRVPPPADFVDPCDGAEPHLTW